MKRPAVVGRIGVVVRKADEALGRPGFEPGLRAAFPVDPLLQAVDVPRVVDGAGFAEGRVAVGFRQRGAVEEDDEAEDGGDGEDNVAADVVAPLPTLGFARVGHPALFQSATTTTAMVTAPSGR